MTVCATLKDGRIIAKGTLTTVSRATSGLVYTSATIAELRKVEELLQVNLTSLVQATPQNPTMGEDYGGGANVVGLSVYLGGSGGASGEAIVLGY